MNKTYWQMALKLGMQYWVWVLSTTKNRCSNDDLGLTVPFFTARVKFIILLSCDFIPENARKLKLGT